MDLLQLVFVSVFYISVIYFQFSDLKLFAALVLSLGAKMWLCLRLCLYIPSLSQFSINIQIYYALLTLQPYVLKGHGPRSHCELFSWNCGLRLTSVWLLHVNFLNQLWLLLSVATAKLCNNCGGEFLISLFPWRLPGDRKSISWTEQTRRRIRRNVVAKVLKLFIGSPSGRQNEPRKLISDSTCWD